MNRMTFSYIAAMNIRFDEEMWSYRNKYLWVNPPIGLPCRYVGRAKKHFVVGETVYPSAITYAAEDTDDISGWDLVPGQKYKVWSTVTGEVSFTLEMRFLYRTPDPEHKLVFDIGEIGTFHFLRFERMP